MTAELCPLRFSVRPAQAPTPRLLALALCGVWSTLAPALHGRAPALAIETAGRGQVKLSWPADPAGYVIEGTARLSGDPAWSPVAATPVLENGRATVTVAAGAMEQYFRLRGRAAPALTTVVRTSPAQGESGVSVNRETILEFSEPLAAGTMIDTGQFFAEFSGRRLLARVELASDRRRATLFFQEPLPGGARVQVTFVGDTVLDSRGQAVDADDDGAPGGAARIAFDTMSTTGLAGTAVIGHVFASEPMPAGGGFANRPLEGVLISVDGAEQRLWTRTDADGFFELEPCPAGRFFVHIDGRTAIGSDWPNGAYYPVVGKTFEAVAGRTNNLAGGTGEIFLPLVPAGTLQPVSATQPTTITFPAEVIAANPALEGVSLTVPPNALFADDGTRGGLVGVAPVAPDCIPSPLPPGLEFPLVFTIQTDGPLNFDQPVAVRFPNLPDPVTGEKLAPGEKAGLWSYNHDTGRWEIQGSMTVTADGNFVETDPGFGIRQPGWHSLNPGSGGEDGGGDEGGPCGPEKQAAEEALFSCAFGLALELAELAPAIGCGISLGSAAASAISDCSDANQSCAGSIAYNGFFGVAGCIPGVGTVTGLAQCLWELSNALADYAVCTELGGPVPLSGPEAGRGRRNNFGLHAPPGFPDDPAAQQLQLSGDFRGLLIAILGDAAWLPAAAADPANLAAFANQLVEALDATSEDGGHISASERDALLSLPAPGGLALSVRTALLDRFDRFAAGGITPDETSAIENAANTLATTAGQLQQRGWTTMGDGLFASQRQSAAAYDQARQGRPQVARRLFFRLVDFETGTVRYGQTEDSGKLVSLPLIGGRTYEIRYLDPRTLKIGTVVFVAGPAGTTTSIPRAQLVAVSSPDTDGDGLNDAAEWIVGTSATNPDTDGDGAPDLQEVQQGQHPLDGLALGEGVVANLPLNGEANGIHVAGRLAYLATGRYGLAIADVADPLQPQLLSQLDLPGDSFDVVVSPAHGVAALAARGEGSGPTALLHFVDVSDPAQPQLKSTLDFASLLADVEITDGLVLLALQREVRFYDPGTALELGSLATQDSITGLRSAGGRVYVATSRALEVFDLALPRPTQLARLVVSLPAPDLFGRVEMALDGGTLFLGKSGGVVTVDVSDLAALRVLDEPETPILAVRALALNGADRLVALTPFLPFDRGAADLSLFDVSDPTEANTLLFSRRSLGLGRDLALFEGLALVADSRSGLTVMNYLGPDTAGQAPMISFEPASIDTDDANPGVQVEAGRRVRLSPRVVDDVQTRLVELLVDGQVVDSTGGFPVNLEFQAAPLPPGVGEAKLTLQIRSVDRAGNTSLSEPVEVSVIPNTQAPALLASFPADGGAAYASEPFALYFSELLNAASMDPARFELVFAGTDGAIGGGDDVLVPPGPLEVAGQTLTAGLAGPLTPGRYQLTLRAGFLSSLGGVPTASDEVLAFTVHDVPTGTALWVSDTDGRFGDGANWIHGRVPSQQPVVIERFGLKPVVTVDATALVASLVSNVPLLVSGNANLHALGDLLARESVEVTGRFLVVDGDATFEKPLTIRGGEVQVGGRLQTGASLTLERGGSLAFIGPEASLALGGPVSAVNFNLSARDGAVIEFPGFVTYDGPGDFTPLFPVGTRFFAQGAGSRLTLPDMTSANGPLDWNVRGVPSVRFEAVSGGTLVLPKLASLTGRTALAADDPDSRVDAPLLATITGPDSDFIASLAATDGGTLDVPALTTLTRVEAALSERRFFDGTTAPGVLDATALQLAEGSILKGVGRVPANVENSATIRLDTAPGSLVVEGDLTLAPTSVLNATIGLGSTRDEAGHLQVQGTLALDGVLRVTLANGYTPAVDDQFEIAAAGTLTGAFASLEGLDLPNGLRLRVDVAAGQVLAVVIQP